MRISDEISDVCSSGLLPRYRVNAVHRVADKRDPVGDDRRAVMKAERIGHARRDEFHRAQPPARALFEFGDEAAFAELGKARPVLFGYRPYEGRAVPPPLVVDQRQPGTGARRVEDFVPDMAMTSEERR